MPLRRHIALQDYSREHHDELLLVWKIREGQKKNISIDRIVAYLLNHFNEATEFHMQNEEQFILERLDDDNEGRNKVIAEHTELRRLISEIASSKTDKTLLVQKFVDLLEKHIRFEEREFFPYLQENFSDESLTLMNPGIEHQHSCPIWDDPFWERS